MSLFIGIDGGGTKTAAAIADSSGAILSQTAVESVSYREHGFEAVEERLLRAVEQLLHGSGASMADVACLAFGAPIYGENSQGDRKLEALAEKLFPHTRRILVNDGAVAYYGALSGRPGVNLVAGTGAIAFGGDGKGRICRCGGWTEQFSDEGSCYWIGRQAMGLFCKQADGRAPKGALYQLFRERFDLAGDMDFIERMERDVLPVRSRVAQLQQLVLQAARMGDGAAAALYDRAAEELAELAQGTRVQLDLPEGAEVSLTGGLLHAGDLILEPLCRRLARLGLRYTPAEHSPLEGAVLLAMRG